MKIKGGLGICDLCEKEHLEKEGTKTHAERFHEIFDVQKSTKLQESGY